MLNFLTFFHTTTTNMNVINWNFMWKKWELLKVICCTKSKGGPTFRFLICIHLFDFTVVCYFVLFFHIKFQLVIFMFVVLSWQNVKKLKVYRHFFQLTVCPYPTNLENVPLCQYQLYCIHCKIDIFSNIYTVKEELSTLIA